MIPMYCAPLGTRQVTRLEVTQTSLLSWSHPVLRSQVYFKWKVWHICTVQCLFICLLNCKIQWTVKDALLTMLPLNEIGQDQVTRVTFSWPDCIYILFSWILIAHWKSLSYILFPVATGDRKTCVEWKCYYLVKRMWLL